MNIRSMEIPEDGNYINKTNALLMQTLFAFHKCDTSPRSDAAQVSCFDAVVLWLGKRKELLLSGISFPSDLQASWSWFIYSAGPPNDLRSQLQPQEFPGQENDQFRL